jgi:4-aminobutyrate aminotransferase
LPERAAELGEHALTRMRELAQRHPLITGVRGLGLLLGMELGRVSKEGAHVPAVAEAERVMYGSLKRGLNFKVTMGNVLTLTPALTITREELDQAFDILDAAIGEVE